MFDKENKKQKIIIMSIIAIVIALVIVKIVDKYYQKDKSQNINLGRLIEENEEKYADEKIKVYITGEVQNEGVIELDQGSRIADAIEKAGGTKEEADLKNVNLAYELEDGQKIYIPNKNETQAKDIEIIDDSSDGIVDDKQNTQMININKAEVEELQNLPRHRRKPSHSDNKI